MVVVNHAVLDAFGAKASVHTGKKIAKMTWQTPDMNLAAAYSLYEVTSVNAPREAIWRTQHPIRTSLVGSKSNNGIAMTLPANAPKYTIEPKDPNYIVDIENSFFNVEQPRHI